MFVYQFKKYFLTQKDRLLIYEIFDFSAFIFCLSVVRRQDLPEATPETTTLNAGSPGRI